VDFSITSLCGENYVAVDNDQRFILSCELADLVDGNDEQLLIFVPPNRSFRGNEF
jgi:hypothetical protein